MSDQWQRGSARPLAALVIISGVGQSEATALAGTRPLSHAAAPALPNLKHTAGGAGSPPSHADVEQALTGRHDGGWRSVSQDGLAWCDG